ncbi:MAG: pyridoxal phosphate-dependent aminotransferase [Pseudomonadota bacterium]
MSEIDQNTANAPEPRRQSYAQWVRQAIGLARGKGTPVISLFESSVPEPRALLRAAVAATVEPDFGHFYVSAFSGGNPFVIDMLAARYGVARDQILGTTGATGGLSLLYGAFTRPGDHILVETPGFDLFQDLAATRGVAIGTFTRRAPDYGIDPAEVEARLRPETRLIVLSNLHNPSGMALDHEVLVRLAEIAERRGVLLVVDEVYGDYADASVRPGPAVALSPAVVSVSSLTKIYGLATLRCGWIVGAASVVEAVRDLGSRLEFGISTLSHAVAARVIEDSAPFLAHSQGVIARSRPLIARWLAEMRAEGLVEGDLPEAGCIFFPRLVGVDDTEAFAAQLIEERGVIVAPGEYFGAAGHVRIGFGLQPGVLEPALEILADALRARRATRGDALLSLAAR